MLGDSGIFGPSLTKVPIKLGAAMRPNPIEVVYSNWTSEV